MENLAGHTKYCAAQLQMAVMWCSPFQCGQLMRHTCWWAPCNQSRRLSLEQPLLTVSGRQWMAWHLKGKPKKLAHHYGTALRSPSSHLDQPGRPPVPAAPVRQSSNGRMSMALSIHYWLPGKQWHGSPSTPQHHIPFGVWWLMGESQDHKHKAMAQKDPAVNLDTALESNLEDLQ